MTTHSAAPVAQEQLATVLVALELSLNTWLVGIGGQERRTVSRYQVKGGDIAGLVSVLRKAQTDVERSSGLPARVHVCFEAGRDGHWLYRALSAQGFVVSEIDPASVAVNRRARRAKTDRLDVEMLVRVQAALVRGEHGVCSVVRVPGVEVEDMRRLHRERDRLVTERTGHIIPTSLKAHRCPRRARASARLAAAAMAAGGPAWDLDDVSNIRLAGII